MQGVRFELTNPLGERALNPPHLTMLCYPCISLVYEFSYLYLDAQRGGALQTAFYYFMTHITSE